MLLNETLTQAELIKKTGLTRKTVRTHIDYLIEDGLIETILKGTRVGYQSVLSEDKLLSEFKSMSFDSMYSLMKEGLPIPKFYFDLTLKMVTKSVQLRKEKQLQAKEKDYTSPNLTLEEYQYIFSSSLYDLFEENKNNLEPFQDFLQTFGSVLENMKNEEDSE